MLIERILCRSSNSICIKPRPKVTGSVCEELRTGRPDLPTLEYRLSSMATRRFSADKGLEFKNYV